MALRLPIQQSAGPGNPHISKMMVWSVSFLALGRLRSLSRSFSSMIRQWWCVARRSSESCSSEGQETFGTSMATRWLLDITCNLAFVETARLKPIYKFLATKGVWAGRFWGTVEGKKQVHQQGQQGRVYLNNYSYSLHSFCSMQLYNTDTVILWWSWYIYTKEWQKVARVSWNKRLMGK